MDVKEFERLLRVEPEDALDDEVYGEYSEYDICEAHIERAATFTQSERDIIVPGLDRNLELILSVLGEYKNKHKRNVMPYHFATSDDIVLTAGIIRPEYFGLTTYRRTGLTVGRYHIIPTAVGVYRIPQDCICIVTDLIELEPAGNVTAVHFVDVDGVTMIRPLEISNAIRTGDIQIYELDLPMIANTTLDLDGKVHLAGLSEITPIGAWICMGKDVPPLVPSV